MNWLNIPVETAMPCSYSTKLKTNLEASRLPLLWALSCNTDIEWNLPPEKWGKLANTASVGSSRTYQNDHQAWSSDGSSVDSSVSTTENYLCFCAMLRTGCVWCIRLFSSQEQQKLTERLGTKLQEVFRSILSQCYVRRPCSEVFVVMNLETVKPICHCSQSFPATTLSEFRKPSNKNKPMYSIRTIIKHNFTNHLFILYANTKNECTGFAVPSMLHLLRIMCSCQLQPSAVKVKKPNNTCSAKRIMNNV